MEPVGAEYGVILNDAHLRQGLSAIQSLSVGHCQSRSATSGSGTGWRLHCMALRHMSIQRFA
jgi:hypothetical protein